jgi:predicted phosphodiesterase
MLIHDGHRVLLTHGQQFENLDDSWSEGACRRKFAEAGIWLGGAMLRVNQRHAFNLFERAFTASLGSEDPKRMTGFRRRALDYARLRRANFIITGHTHKAVIAHPHNGITFINTGSCLGKRVDWISLDLDRNEISLIKSELT